jgi:hypothetical protein
VIANLCTEINAPAGCNGAAVEPFKRAFGRPGDDKGEEGLINYTAVPVGQQIMLYGESSSVSKKKYIALIILPYYQIIPLYSSSVNITFS